MTQYRLLAFQMLWTGNPAWRYLESYPRLVDALNAQQALEYVSGVPAVIQFDHLVREG